MRCVMWRIFGAWRWQSLSNAAISPLLATATSLSSLTTWGSSDRELPPLLLEFDEINPAVAIIFSPAVSLLRKPEQQAKYQHVRRRCCLVKHLLSMAYVPRKFCLSAMPRVKRHASDT